MVKEEEPGTPMAGAPAAGDESPWNSDGPPPPALAISSNDAGTTSDNTRKSCPGLLAYSFNGLRLESDDATGWLYFAAGSTAATMSNIFLATSFIFLAKREVGCEEEDVERTAKVYGMKPSSLISVIGTVSGLLTAFFLPIIGAIVDYTSFRWECGAYASAVFILIQAIQIGTGDRTWFVMAILQAINGFLYQIGYLCVFAYLPEIGAVTERKTFTWYNTLYSMFGFGVSVLFLVTVVGVGLAFSLDDQRIGQMGQAIDVFVTGGFFYLAWYFFHRRGPRNTLKEGERLWPAGFRQVFRTTKQISQHYPRSVGLFFTGMMFVSSAVESFSPVAVTYLNEVLDFNATQVGILYIIVLVCMLPGSYFAYWLATKTTPLTAFKIFIGTFILVNFGAFFWLTDPSMEIEAYICGMFWGFWLGQYYPLNKLIYSLIVPPFQEAELSGLWRYCTQILSWAPPLVFTLLNESGIPLSWGGVSCNFFLVIGLLLFMLMQSWDDCLKEAKVNKMKGEEATVLMV